MTTTPTEPIGSIPRPPALIEARKAFLAGRLARAEVDALCDEVIRETVQRFEARGSPVITDGEQRKYHNVVTYSVAGLPNFAPNGFQPHLTAGHDREWPRLTMTARGSLGALGIDLVGWALGE